MAHPLFDYKEDEKPWGSSELFTKEEKSTVKILRIASGKRFSLQRHKNREEFWRVIEGSGVITVGDTERAVTVGDEALVPRETLHRIAGGPGGIAVLEISFGAFDENDIERLEDDFGRT